MDKKHRDLIICKSGLLAKSMNLDLVMPFIILKKIFTPAMLDDIYCKKDDFSRKQKFLSELPTRGPLAFKKFYEALVMAGEKDATKLLENLNSTLDDTDKSAAVELNGNNHMQDFVENMNEMTLSECKYKSEAYKMCSDPRGYCLIINNVDFGGLEEERIGSTLDVERLDRLFHDLGYETTVETNLSALDMKIKLYDFSKKPEHEFVDSCAVIIMTHGGTGFVLGTDCDSLDIDDIIDMFDNYNCKHLVGKPKMFFIQACRGTKFDSGLYKSQFSDSLKVSSFSDKDVEINPKRLPTVTDMIISYSTVKHYVSVRDHNLGAWYCEKIVKVFTEDAEHLDLETMLRRVAKEMKDLTSIDGDKQTIETVLKGWDHKLYFNPMKSFRLNNTKDA